MRANFEEGGTVEDGIEVLTNADEQQEQHI
jgi:hypothetical protein